MVACKKNIFFKVVIFSSFLFLAGCALFSGSNTEFEKASLTPSGIRLEQMLPSSTFMLGEVNLINEQQKKLGEKIKDYFPKPEGGNVEEQFIKPLNEQLQGYGLTYENDIKPLLSVNERYTLAMTESTDQNPMMYLSAIIQDTAKFDAILAKVAKGKEVQVTLEEYKGRKILVDKNTEIFVTRMEDLFVSAKGLGTAKEMIDRYESKKDILAKANSYVQVIEKMPAERVGFIFFNVKKMMDLSSVASSLTGEEMAVLQKSPLQKLTEYEGMAFTLTEEGGRLVGKYLSAADSTINYSDFGRERYVYKAVPGQDLFLYFESANLMKIVELMMGDKESDSYKNVIATLEKYNLKLEDFSFMNKGFAISIHDNLKQLIPGISIIIDADSDPQKAQDLARKLDAQIGGIIMLLQSLKEGQLAGMIQTREVNLQGNKLKAVVVDLSKLAEEVPPASKTEEGTEASPELKPSLEFLKGQSVSFIYGLTPDNKLIISTYQGWEANYGKGGLDANSEYTKVKGEIENYKEGLFFVNTKVFFDYAETLMQSMSTMNQAPVSDEMLKSFELFKGYLAPIKSIIFAANFAKKTAESLGFVRMEKPQN